ncbi:glutathione S-transferase family protein [Comamonas sp.]|uniref:glutathione S-transferase family protein n=1 Tax=Comamonas sp. TaxID=34028 RepID=UPI003D107766
MIELYHCVSARSFRALWMLEELGLPYQLQMLPFPPRTLAKHYLALNPLGTVPLLIDGDTRMTESSAICQYLARRDPAQRLDVQPSDPAYGSYLNWLYMSDTTLTFPQTLVLRYQFFEPAVRRQPQVAEDYARWFLGRLRALETAAQAMPAELPYLCAGRFTAADVAVGYALMLSDYLGMSSQWGPATQHYWMHLQQRAAFLRSLEVEKQAALDQQIDPIPSPLIRP